MSSMDVFLQEICQLVELEGGVVALDAEWKPFQTGPNGRLGKDKQVKSAE